MSIATNARTSGIGYVHILDSFLQVWHLGDAFVGGSVLGIEIHYVVEGAISSLAQLNQGLSKLDLQEHSLLKQLWNFLTQCGTS